MLSGLFGGASGQAKSATRNQIKVLKKQSKIADLLQSIVDQRYQAGYFDADKQIAALNRYSYEAEGRDAGNQAGELRIMGYKPGDSEGRVRSNALRAKYQDSRDRMALDLKGQELQNILGAYNQAAAPLQGLASGFGNAAQIAQSQQADMGPLFSLLSGGLSNAFRSPSQPRPALSNAQVRSFVRGVRF